MKIILLSGKAESGKTTAANIIKKALEQQGERVAITPYGQLVKDLCKMLYGWNGQKDEAGRQLLQYIGTDVIRKERPNYWVDHIIDLASILYDEFDTFIVDDCRFPNEIEKWEYFVERMTICKEWYSRYYGVFWIRIDRPNYENHLTPEQRLHPSETALDHYTGIRECPCIMKAGINNSEGLDEFKDDILYVLNKFNMLKENYLWTTGKET